ncbi:MAG: PocR ligand-binding domain-containing protein [Deltaproteobacteria bacterium]|nr:PocR ligand-binding domain-containing protein [Deltaproteobacteria bacterium]
MTSEAFLESGTRGSILDRHITLAELLDLRSFRELCASYVDLYKIGIKVFDADGSKLVDIRVGNGDWCGYVFSNSEGRRMCTALVTKIKQHEYPELDDGLIVEQQCFSGLKYMLMPITHGGETLGRIIWGPFVPAELERPGVAVYAYPDGFDPSKLWSFGDKIRRLPDATIRKIMLNFRHAIDGVVSIAYRALMTQNLHLESITASYNELAVTNRALRESVERLKEVDRLKSSFLAMISHELRTPLTSIIGYSEMLLEGMAGDLAGEQKDFVGTIQEKGETLLSLISAILDISKIEAGAMHITPSETSLEAIVASAQKSIVPQAQKKALILETRISPDVPRIHADHDKLVQCIVNLFANAVKFTPNGGRITLKAYPFEGSRKSGGDQGRFGALRERFVRIDVADTGIGISKDKFNDVFRAFYQVDNSFTREYGGTGLGLAIVKSFVEAHSGEVWVESEEGKGTTFSILLPMDGAPKREARIATM